jgi:hypothetical protein
MKLILIILQPKGNGKYVFDIGAEQIGEYLTTAQVIESLKYVKVYKKIIFFNLK